MKALRAYGAHVVTHGDRQGTPKKAFESKQAALMWLSEKHDGVGGAYLCPRCAKWHVTMRALPNRTPRTGETTSDDRSSATDADPSADGDRPPGRHGENRDGRVG